MISGQATKDKSVTDHRLCDPRSTKGDHDHEVVQAASSLKTCDVSPPLASASSSYSLFALIDYVIVMICCIPVTYLFMHSFIKYQNNTGSHRYNYRCNSDSGHSIFP